MTPFIKWAGGKRWLIENSEFAFPNFTGRYFEPFLGSAAVFFHLKPKSAILSDTNKRLIETYRAIRDDWQKVQSELEKLQRYHSNNFYYEERSRVRRRCYTRAAQFLYLNRTCWNGLYRENLNGKFNVPIGTKTSVIMATDDFESASNILSGAELYNQDFEEIMLEAERGDLIFLDPPYTTAHNMNGFVKYNQKIFTWDDQLRLKKATCEAIRRGVSVVLTNAHHESILKLYSDIGEPEIFSRISIISGTASARKLTTEAIYVF